MFFYLSEVVLFFFLYVTILSVNLCTCASDVYGTGVTLRMLGFEHMLWKRKQPVFFSRPPVFSLITLHLTLRQGLTLTCSSSICQAGWPASPEESYCLPFQQWNTSPSAMLGLKACVATTFCLCHWVFFSFLFKSFLVTIEEGNEMTISWKTPLFG